MFCFFTAIFCFHRKFLAPPERFPSAVDAACRSIDVAPWQKPIRGFVVLPLPSQRSHYSKREIQCFLFIVLQTNGKKKRIITFITRWCWVFLDAFLFSAEPIICVALLKQMTRGAAEQKAGPRWVSGGADKFFPAVNSQCHGR